MPRCASDPDGAAGFPDDLFDDEEPQAGAFARLFGGEQGIEYFVPDLLYHTAAGVGNLEYCSSLRDRQKAPLSVDMLDTGIDIHEIVNLVFFKVIHSKVKFWQMIGRGTRTCPDLFGPGNDKKYFLVFDYCENFNFFDLKPKGITPGSVEPLSQKIFKKRLALYRNLEDTTHQSNPENRRLREHLQETMHHDVKNLDVNLFFIRPHQEYVEIYSRRDRWDKLNWDDYSNIDQELSPLMTPADDDELARRFDLLILNLQLALAENIRNRQPYMKRLRQITSGQQAAGPFLHGL